MEGQDGDDVGLRITGHIFDTIYDYSTLQRGVGEYLSLFGHFVVLGYIAALSRGYNA
jgi:hypothetical protein